MIVLLCVNAGILKWGIWLHLAIITYGINYYMNEKCDEILAFIVIWVVS